MESKIGSFQLNFISAAHRDGELCALNGAPRCGGVLLEGGWLCGAKTVNKQHAAGLTTPAGALALVRKPRSRPASMAGALAAILVASWLAYAPHSLAPAISRHPMHPSTGRYPANVEMLFGRNNVSRSSGRTERGSGLPKRDASDYTSGTPPRNRLRNGLGFGSLLAASGGAGAVAVKNKARILPIVLIHGILSSAIHFEEAADWAHALGEDDVQHRDWQRRGRLDYSTYVLAHCAPSQHPSSVRTARAL